MLLVYNEDNQFAEFVYGLKYAPYKRIIGENLVRAAYNIFNHGPEYYGLDYGR
jgi:hypothetical protein